MSLTDCILLTQLYRKGALDLAELAGAERVGGSRAVFAAVTEERDRLRQKLETKPKLSNEDLKQDMRWIAAQIAILTEILGLPALARETIEKLEKSE